jgi:wyosine [tRNA(Phe)-imidazoG37] synthetase (radical SAM superfamily)
MEILLAILSLLLGGLVCYLLYLIKKLKKDSDNLKHQAIFLSKKDLEFLEFTADMYIKYSKELNIHSKEQHDYIVSELERIIKILNEKINS